MTEHEADVLKSLFLKAIKSKVSEEELNECWDRSGIAGRGNFEEALVEAGLKYAIWGLTSRGTTKKLQTY